MEARCGNTNLSSHHWELTQEDCQEQDEKHEVPEAHTSRAKNENPNSLLCRS